MLCAVGLSAQDSKFSGPSDADPPVTAIDEVLAKGNHYEHKLKDYNNDPKTTFADVQKFFTIVEEESKND